MLSARRLALHALRGPHRAAATLTSRLAPAIRALSTNHAGGKIDETAAKPKSRPLKDIPVGPYMETSTSDSAAPLPPPPASPAATTFHSQGLDTRPFARSPGRATDAHQRRLNNIAAGDAPAGLTRGQDGETPLWEGDAFDEEGHSLASAGGEEGAKDEAAAGGRERKATRKSRAKPAAASRSKGTTLTGSGSSRVGSSSRRLFSSATTIPPVATPVVFQTITSTTPAQDVATVVASASVLSPTQEFQPKRSEGYAFDKPQTPPTFTPNAEETTTTTATLNSDGTVRVDSTTTSTTDPLNSSASSSSVSGSSSSSDPGARTAANLLDLSQLPQAFAFVESLVPKDLSQLSQLPEQLAKASSEVLKTVQQVVPVPLPQLPDPQQVVTIIQTAVNGGIATSGFGGGRGRDGNNNNVNNNFNDNRNDFNRNMNGMNSNGRKDGTACENPYTATSDASCNSSYSSSSSSSSSCGLSGRSSRQPTKHDILSEILRVDHAGEYGAQRVQDGQLAAMAAINAMTGGMLGSRPSRGSRQGRKDGDRRRDDDLSASSKERDDDLFSASHQTQPNGAGRSEDATSLDMAQATPTIDPVNTAFATSPSYNPETCERGVDASRSSFSSNGGDSSSSSDSRGRRNGRGTSSESPHLREFERLLPQYQVRPTALLPLVDALGFSLGAASALFGDRAARACTSAVESALSRQYNDQLRTLSQAGFEDEAELRKLIRKHRDHEDEQRGGRDQQRSDRNRNDPFAMPLQMMTGAVQAASQAAVWITRRV